MRERLTGDLVLGDAQEDDHGSAQGRGVAVDVRSQRLRDRSGTEPCGQGGRNGGDDLGGGDDAVPGGQVVIAFMPVDPIDRAADAELTTKGAIAGGNRTRSLRIPPCAGSGRHRGW